MKKFEYLRIRKSDDQMSAKTLNELGEEGWELVTHVIENKFGLINYFYFKREIINTES